MGKKMRHSGIHTYAFQTKKPSSILKPWLTPCHKLLPSRQPLLDNRPFVDLDTLPQLKELTVLDRGLVDLAITQPTKNLMLVDFRSNYGPKNLDWLEYSTKSLRHLVLFNQHNGLRSSE